jgi:hypothetical protein
MTLLAIRAARVEGEDAMYTRAADNAHPAISPSASAWSPAKKRVAAEQLLHRFHLLLLPRPAITGSYVSFPGSRRIQPMVPPGGDLRTCVPQRAGSQLRA